MPNRLSRSQSPYLRQHQDNPVDWFEWGEEAFQEAKQRDVPILLSIGYAACHWCHVMAHESFEDEAIAQIMNRDFVNIKVDREERPDIDAIYMAATQAIAGHGGWPMTVFLNHELQPYYAGTYFPPSQQHGLPSFRELLEAMSDAWKNQRKLIDESVTQITEHLKVQNSKLSHRTLERQEVLDRAIEALREEFDLNNAGFGGAPKFPPHTTLLFLLRYLSHHPNQEVMGWVERTAMAMASGGMYDQLGGGFARYSVDSRWLVPHFEKMLYDNALLAEVYAELVIRTNNPRYEKVLSDTVNFVLRELRTPAGAFAASLDADSESEEGKFYVFDKDELAEALGEDAEVAASIYRISDIESFENGKSVLQFDSQIAIESEKLDQIQSRLFAYRERRTRPETDAKVITSWNSWMIKALFRAATALNDRDTADAAKKALDYLVGHHLIEHELFRSSLDGQVSRISGQLEDWASLGGALLAAHAYFGDASYFQTAKWVADQILERFKDDVLYDTEAQHTQTPVRPRSLADSGSPSPHGLAAELFRQIWLLTGDSKYFDETNQILEELTDLMATAPRATSGALRSLVGMEGVKEFAVVGAKSQLHNFVLGLPDDGSVVSAGEPGATALLENREYLNGKSTVYVCEGFSCKLPVSEIEQLQAQLDPGL